MQRNLNRRAFMASGSAGLAAFAAIRPLSVQAQSLIDSKLTHQAIDPMTLVAPELRGVAKNMANTGMMLARMSPKVLPQMRTGMARLDPTPLPDVPYEEKTISGPPGAPDVKIYVINATPKPNRPAILHMHGGGYVSGSAKGSILPMQILAKTLDCLIVTVEYRLAPEATYKGSIEDNYAALKWLHSSAETLRVEPSRIALLGESAGGGHAALLALYARDRGKVPIAFQCLIYPMLDDRTGTTRAVPDHIGTFLWTRPANRFGWTSFLGMEPGGDNVPDAAVPARRNDLASLPPTFIGVGSIDLFVEEDIAYANRLVDCGVPTELHVVPGCFHGFDGLSSGPLATSFNEAKINALRRALAPRN